MAIVQSKYVEKRPERKVFSVSLQHFSPVGEAFHRFLQGLDEPFYSVKILESTTSDVIADVAAGRSEIGFLHFSGENEPVILKDIRNEKLEFYSIRHVEPCLLLRWDHPLAAWDTISRAALDDYPLIAYDGGTDGTVYSSEDYSAPLQADRQIVVSDGLQMLDLLRTTNACAIGLSGQYALVRESGVVTRPLADVKPLRLGWIKKADTVLQPLAKRYLRMLNPE
jgi:DNA-binding transcriptional LysR family regulator